MHTPEEIREELTEVLGLVTGETVESVRDTADLKDLGIDSVATVELAEGVAARFDVSLDDDSVNEWRTVGDVVRTVVRKSMPAPVIDQTADRPHFPPPEKSEADPERAGAFKQLAVVFALIGAVVGVIIGVSAAALLASGLDRGTLPPANPPSAPTAAPPDSSDTYGSGGGVRPSPVAPARASLTATPGIVPAGQRFRLSGRLPNARPGETLTIEWRESGAPWAPFPVTATAQDGGTFDTQIYIGSPGERQFRVRSQSAGGATPPTMVRIS